MAKLKRARQAGTSKANIVAKPVVLEIRLTPTQRATVTKLTGRSVGTLQLSNDELQLVVGAAAIKW